MDKLRLGGMALSNGVLVHGPTSWGAAVRASDGSIKSASGVKRRFAPNVTTPFVRGPLRLAEAFAVLPDVRRALPEARFPFERPRVAVAVIAGAAAAGVARRSQLGFLGKEAVAAFASLAPAVIALRGGDLASYHGAEHISIGTYETGEPATKEHDRCGWPPRRPAAPDERCRERAGRPCSRLGTAGRKGAWRCRGDGRCRRDLRLDGPSSRAATGTRSRAARPHLADAHLDGRALGGPARGRGSRSLRLPEGRRAGVTQRGERLDPDVFDLPVEKMREGYYTDAYFNHTRSTLLADGRHPRVLMQVFQRHTAMLGGMDEAIAVLKLCSDDWDGLEVFALYDGDTIEPWETVMTIEGDYTLFGHLETVYLGVLARRTLISTNTERVLRAANGKPIIFMAARHDHHRVQTGDGYAAYVAGAIRGSEIGVTSDAQASWWGGRGVGTVPHALIAAYGGDTVLAARKFAEWAPDDLRITVLVDFANDSVATALAVADALGPKLWGVRLDTSGQLVDRSLWEELGDFDPRGVNERLVRKVRAALDGAGHEQVRIVASGGFSVAKIEEFERRGVPVDAYGVGSSLIRGENDFTADIIAADGRPSAKVGRRLRPNARLERVL